MGAQRLSSSIRLLRVPVRVLSVEPRLAMRRDSRVDDDVGRANPFLPADDEGERGPDATLQLLQHSVARRAPHCYNIANQVRVLTVHLLAAALPGRWQILRFNRAQSVTGSYAYLMSR